MYEKEIGANRGDISGDTDKLKEFTAEVNVALDDFIELAIRSNGKWQFDDSNHTDYNIIKTNLVSGQRDYSFTTDANGNLILDIYKVMVLPSATATDYVEIFPIDQQSERSSIDTENATGGVPYRYDKTANGIFLDPLPNFNATLGLKLMINREGSYFSYSDTTKKPGVPGLFHSYFFLKPALKYAGIHGLANYNDILKKVIALEGDTEKGVSGKIQHYFASRSKDESESISGECIDAI